MIEGPSIKVTEKETGAFISIPGQGGPGSYFLLRALF